MTKTIKARFEQLRQDMFWSIYDRKTDQIIRWSGYNDANWWNKVAPSCAFRVRGKYTLDPETNEVTFEESENE